MKAGSRFIAMALAGLAALAPRPAAAQAEVHALTLQEAIRKLAALPAQNLRVDRRGMLKKGYFADVVVFDAQKIQDRATFAEPHQYATGMIHVFVNGQQVLKDGEHTGAKPGRVVRGPGWMGR